MKSKVWRPGSSKKQRPARLKFEKNNKSLTVERGQNDHRFWINAQNILFQLPNLKRYIAWGSK